MAEILHPAVQNTPSDEGSDRHENNHTSADLKGKIVYLFAHPEIDAYREMVQASLVLQLLGILEIVQLEVLLVALCHHINYRIYLP